MVHQVGVVIDAKELLPPKRQAPDLTHRELLGLLSPPTLGGPESHDLVLYGIL